MTRRQIAFYTAFLAVLGAGWGFTQPMTKIAVSTGYQHFGLVFWQMVIGAVFMTVINTFRRKRLPIRRPYLWLYLLLALIGTIIPNTAGYQAAVWLPSGVLSLLLSIVPMFAFPIALAMGLDRFSIRRMGGLAFGLAGVLVLVVPGSDLSGSLPAFWIFVALIAGLCYALEGNIVAKWGILDLDAFQVLQGASVTGALIILPVAIATGQFIDPTPPLDAAQMALLASSVVHVLVYSGYMWLVGRAGAVFAVQVSYLVTGFGLIWAKIILSEAYAPTLWIALAMMFAGLYLVQPRPKAALAQVDPISDTDS
ncbi:DMT family transporter [Sulfitobacter sp.]|uniref:DMT family transporter n=1 Tax=Sulfitobacter sp. TaxID=1903071 RepID=UPI000C0CD7DF|nr:EamA family transporter [Roseobacter sp.]MBV48350.1 EamA family transporter [Roseobacter sp.]PHR09024.1 MAG: EamA family transporter [Sulfitobacter sp.]